MPHDENSGDAPGAPLTHTESPDTDALVQEFQRLVAEGWEPELEEFISRVPESIRDEVFAQLDEKIEKINSESWTGDELPAEPENEGLASESIPEECSSELEPAPHVVSIALPQEADVEPEPMLEHQPLSRPMFEPEPQAEPEPDSLAQMMYEAEPEEEAEPEAEPEPVYEAELVPEPEPVYEAVLEPEPDSIHDAETESDPEPMYESVAEAESDEEPDEEPQTPRSHPKAVGGFQIANELGCGTMGVAYHAHPSGENYPVVLRVVPVDLSSKLLSRVLTRAEKVTAVGIEGLLAVHEAVDAEEGTLLVSPYAEGKPIDRVAGEFDFDGRALILRGFAELLAQAHAADLLHLDLRPNNVIVAETGVVQIVDFGVGAAVLATPKREADFAGLPHFASPEHAPRGRISSKSDVFSFGSVMYHVLTGEMPFPGAAPDAIEARIEDADPIVPRLHDGQIPSALQDICLACLARNPSDRPDAIDLLDALDRFMAGRPSLMRPQHYRSFLRRRTREMIAEVRTWERSELATGTEADRVESICRRLLAREEQWSHDTTHAPRTAALVGISSALFAVGAGLLAYFDYAHVSQLAVALPMAGVAALTGSAVIAGRSGERRLSTTLVAGALAALLPSIVLLLQRLNLLTGAGPIAAVSFAQIASVASVGAVLSAGLLAKRRDAVYAWSTCVALVAAYAALLGAAGLFASGAALASAAFAPLAFLLIAATRMESAGRFAWMRPFLWTGLAALLVLPFAAATAGLQVAGLAVVDPFAGALVATGLVGWAFSLLVRRVSSAALRETARFVARAAPVAVLGGLVWNAAATGLDVAWLGALGGSIVLMMHGALCSDRSTFAWGLAGALAGAVATALLGFAPPWIMAISLVGAGLFFAIVLTVSPHFSRAP